MTAGTRGRAALVLATATLAGCGAESDETTGAKATSSPASGVGLVRAGSTAQFADCADWRRGTVEQRRTTIESIRGQLTPQRSKTARSALADDAAYRILDNTCSSGITDSLRLYKLYYRAQGFAPLTGAGSR